MTATSTGDYGQIVNLIPGGGWMGEYRKSDGMWSIPIVAWALTERGYVIPMEVDSDGLVEPSRADRIYHPDTVPPGSGAADPSTSVD
ncbi:MAG TPA: hypothetical protein VK360_00065 [Acidimicrobiales bacterium]|nr:hypothetical protein [Acidimicrobiales bacterium]